MASQNIGQFICEYRTMFEDVVNTNPNIRPKDDVMYSSMDYGKIFGRICEFLEGYISYRNENDQMYDSKILASTKAFYDSMFSDMDCNSPYRKTCTLEDMRSNVMESFLTGTKNLQMVMESMQTQYPDMQTEQLIVMTNNQFNKLAKVYRDDMDLYMWLATRNSKTNPKQASMQNRINFMNVNTPVVHRLDAYSSNN